MQFVQQQFFPNSDRPELIVDWTLPQNASIADTSAQMARFEKEMLAGEPDIELWSTYVGQGAPRFVLSFDVQPSDALLRPDGDPDQEHRGARPAAHQIPGLAAARPSPAPMPSCSCSTSGRRSAGRCNIASAGRTSSKVRDAGRRSSATSSRPTRISTNVTFDWNEPARVDQGRGAAGQGAPARRLVAGHRLGPQQRRRRLDCHPVARRHLSHRRHRPGATPRSALDRNAAKPAAAAATAARPSRWRRWRHFSYGLEQPVIWRRARQPDRHHQGGDRGQDGSRRPSSPQLAPELKKFNAALPPGYQGRGRRRGGGKRQVARPDQRRGCR